MSNLWHQVGRELVLAFDHVSVISLPRSRGRRVHMRNLLHVQLGLTEGSEFGFSNALDCLEYGQWRDVPFLLERRPEHVDGTNAWWIQQSQCNSSQGPPDCAHTEFSRCRDATKRGFPNCKYVCYTLSVAIALHEFLRSNATSMLLLEDDVCATPALAESGSVLAELRQGGWDIAKLGHCDPCDNGEDGERTLAGGYSKCLEHNTSFQQSWARENSVWRTLGKSFCAHALAVTRVGAERLLRLAFPATAVFDDMLMLLGGGFGPIASKNALRYLGLRTDKELRAVHTRDSLFSQWSRQAHSTEPGNLNVIDCPTWPKCAPGEEDEDGLPGTWRRWWGCSSDV